MGYLLMVKFWNSRQNSSTSYSVQTWFFNAFGCRIRRISTATMCWRFLRLICPEEIVLHFFFGTSFDFAICVIVLTLHRWWLPYDVLWVKHICAPTRLMLRSHAKHNSSFFLCWFHLVLPCTNCLFFPFYCSAGFFLIEIKIDLFQKLAFLIATKYA